MPPTHDQEPVNPTRRRPYVSDTGPTKSAVIAHERLIAAASCPAAATEVRNAAASATRSGPNIRAAVRTRNTAAESRRTSNPGEMGRSHTRLHASCAMSISPRSRHYSGPTPGISGGRGPAAACRCWAAHGTRHLQEASSTHSETPPLWSPVSHCQSKCMQSVFSRVWLKRASARPAFNSWEMVTHW